MTNKEIFDYVLANNLTGPAGTNDFDANLLRASADTRKQIMFRCVQRALASGRPLSTVGRLTYAEVEAINAIFAVRM